MDSFFLWFGEYISLGLPFCPLEQCLRDCYSENYKIKHSNCFDDILADGFFYNNSCFCVRFAKRFMYELILVYDVAKKTGDAPALSLTDIKVLALAHDLFLENCGKDGLTYDVRTIKTTENRKGEQTAGAEDRGKGNSAVNETINQDATANTDPVVEFAETAGFYQPPSKVFLVFDGLSNIFENYFRCCSFLAITF